MRKNLRLNVADICHIQHEMGHGGTDAHVSARAHQHPQIANSFTNSVVPLAVCLYGQTAAEIAPRLASLTSQGIQYSLTPWCAGVFRIINLLVVLAMEAGTQKQTLKSAGTDRETDSTSSNESSMDMVSDSAGNEFHQCCLCFSS